MATGAGLKQTRDRGSLPPPEVAAFKPYTYLLRTQLIVGRTDEDCIRWCRKLGRRAVVCIVCGRARPAVAGVAGERQQTLAPRTLANLAAAVSGGLLLAASFPPLGWWICATLGLALLGWVLADPRTRAVGGFGYGLVFGLAFYLPLLPWVGVLVGPLPWVALALVCALFPAVFAVPAVLLRGLTGWPLWWAAWWTAVEGLKGVIPFGGFPWGTVAFSQADGPLAVFARLGGVPLVSFITALLSFCVAAVVLLVRRSNRAGFVGAVATPVLCFAVVIAAAATMTPLVRNPTGYGGSSMTVAWCRGTCRASVWISMPSAARCSTTTCVRRCGLPRTSAQVAPTHRNSSCGQRIPRMSIRSPTRMQRVRLRGQLGRSVRRFWSVPL